MKNISTIANELKQSNPELGNPTARDLNNMLLVKGMICIVVDGKSPTKLGIQKGIIKKVNKNDMGQRYVYPVYNEQAESYVKSLAIEYFAPHQEVEPAPEVPQEIVVPNENAPIYKYTHKDYEAAQSLHKDRLVILEGPDAYWTYFQDARILSRIMHWRIYENRRNIPGITFPKEHLETVLESLDRNSTSWIVCGSSGVRLSSSAYAVEPIPEDAPSIVEIGSYIRVLINGTFEKGFFLREANATPFIAHVSATGMVISTERTSYEDDSITVDSPAGRAILGKRIGETVQVCTSDTTNIYQIIDIK